MTSAAALAIAEEQSEPSKPTSALGSKGPQTLAEALRAELQGLGHVEWPPHNQQPTQETTMTVREILNGAADRLKRKGWLQGCYAVTVEDILPTKERGVIKAGSPCHARGNLLWTPVGATDVIGALRQTGSNDPNVEEAKALLRSQLGVDNLADWNDEEGRTKDQVISALRKAATSV